MLDEKQLRLCKEAVANLLGLTVQFHEPSHLFIELWTNKNGLHRGDGPAVIGSDGYMGWYKNGSLHRENGPAQIFPDMHRHYPGAKFWWLNGIKLMGKHWSQV